MKRWRKVLNHPVFDAQVDVAITAVCGAVLYHGIQVGDAFLIILPGLLLAARCIIEALEAWENKATPEKRLVLHVDEVALLKAYHRVTKGTDA